MQRPNDMHNQELSQAPCMPAEASGDMPAERMDAVDAAQKRRNARSPPRAIRTHRIHAGNGHTARMFETVAMFQLVTSALKVVVEANICEQKHRRQKAAPETACMAATRTQVAAQHRRIAEEGRSLILRSTACQDRTAHTALMQGTEPV
jgi:hypothetical protein